VKHHIILCVSALVASHWLTQTSPAAAQAYGSVVPWHSVVLEKSLELEVSAADKEPASRLPTVIYLKNLPAPRVGTEGDEAILTDLRAAGYLVAVLDYANDPRARVPHLNRDLSKLRADLMNGQLLSEFPVDQARIFIVPGGCRLKRDVVFYRDDGHAFALDIIHPALPKQPVGTILEFSCENRDRMSNVSLSVCTDTILDSMATEGFAVAMADHPVPLQYKGIDPMPECAWRVKAAVRTLRAEGTNLGLNGRIVPVGFSRGSGMALMLVTTEGKPEFEGHGEHQGVSSAVDGGVIMSGRFTYLDLLPDDRMLPRYTQAWGDIQSHREVWRRHGALDYLQEATEPLFLTINCAEAPDAMHQMLVLRKRLAELGNDEVFMMDRESRAHKVTLDPEILSAMRNYFAARLRAPAEKRP
jgi:hypothetical protein